MFNYSKDNDNIVTITMDMQGRSANVINQEFGKLWLETIDRLEKEKAEIAGVVLTSAKSTFFAGASSLLINVTGGNDLTINDWNEVSQIITSQVDTNANIIIGLNEEEGLNEKIRVTVIATGFRARLPHTLNSLKRDQAPVNKEQQQPQRDQREVQQQPQPMVRPKVVNMPDPHDYIEPTRSIKTPQRVNSPYNCTEVGA